MDSSIKYNKHDFIVTLGVNSLGAGMLDSLLMKCALVQMLHILS